MSSRPQLHQHPRLTHSILSSTGNAIGMYRINQMSVGSGEKATQTLLPHRFGRRFLLNIVLARAAISFQLVTHHFFRHDLAGERSRSSCRSSPPCCRSGSTRVPRQGLLSVSPAPPRSNTDHPRADQNLQLLRYTLEVEALDRGKSVQKRISVIFPIQPPDATQQQVSQHFSVRDARCQTH